MPVFYHVFLFYQGVTMISIGWTHTIAAVLIPSAPTFFSPKICCHFQDFRMGGEKQGERKRAEKI